jgi:hypothetical protein
VKNKHFRVETYLESAEEGLKVDLNHRKCHGI